jgi:hypothetical protein
MSQSSGVSTDTSLGHINFFMIVKGYAEEAIY